MDNGSKTLTILEAAQHFLTMGWRPIPVPPRTKAPILKGWQNLCLVDSDLSAYFSNPGNIGLLLGEASGGLVDVDLDTMDAIFAAKEFLPDTLMVHGRQSKPSSHWWYVVSGPVPKAERFLELDGTCIAELRSTGGQTIVPPSIHPSGEAIAWERTGAPASVNGETIRSSVAYLAASVLLGRAWPKQPGSRQQVAMAVAGFLLRNGLAEDQVANIIGMAAQIAKDEEFRKRTDSARDTAKALAAGENVTGGPHAASLLNDGSRVIERLSSWLKLQTESQPFVWETPEPFIDHCAVTFPVEALPKPIRDFVLAQSEALQTPVDLVASLVIGVGAAAAAGRCIVSLNREWTEPLNLFIVVALPSGEKKSPAFRAVAGPLEEREQSLAALYRPEIAMQKSEHDILEFQLQAAKLKAAKAGAQNRDSDGMKEVIDLSGKLANHKLQKAPRFLADDATSESVASLLAENEGRIAIMSPEGGLFEILGGRYSGQPNIEVYLKGYSGDTIRVDRKSRAPEFIKKPALTLCLTVQPRVIEDLMVNDLFRGKGLLARLLYSLPITMVGYRSMIVSLVPEEMRAKWRETVMSILKLPDPRDGQENSLCLSSEATKAFQEFRERVELQLRPEGELSGIADWGNKFPGNVARIAGIFHLFCHAAEGEPWKVPISKSNILAAIKVGSYYAEHALTAFKMMGTDPDIQKARRLWATIKSQSFDIFSQRDLHQRVRRSFTPADIAAGLSSLERLGYIKKLPHDAVGGVGRKPSPTYEVNPLACTQNTQNPQNGENLYYSEDSEDCVYTQGEFIQADQQSDNINSPPRENVSPEPVVSPSSAPSDDWVEI